MSPQVLCILVTETKANQCMMCNGNQKILKKISINVFAYPSTMISGPSEWDHGSPRAHEGVMLKDLNQSCPEV